MTPTATTGWTPCCKRWITRTGRSGSQPPPATASACRWLWQGTRWPVSQVYPEPTGRGFFAGIGIAPQYQHRHLGKLLFFRLCAEEKRAGAVYMSLFTGVANPARRIYESAGFTSVRTFGVLLKTL